jgi:hypothetical protein
MRLFHTTLAWLSLLSAHAAYAQSSDVAEPSCTRLWVDEAMWTCEAPASDVPPTFVSDCPVVGVDLTWHTLAGQDAPMQLAQIHCADRSTLVALTDEGIVDVRNSRAGEDAFVLISTGTQEAPVPLVISRVPNALRQCRYLPPLLTGTWTPGRGLSGVVARFTLPDNELPATTGLRHPDNFSDDTRAVFVSRRADLGISHSWGDAPTSAWDPGDGSTPPFAVFRAESVPAVSLTVQDLSRAADAVLFGDDGRRWRIALPAGDSTISLPEDIGPGCISLQFDDSGALLIGSLGMNTELDLRPLDRAIDVYLLTELGSDDARRRMAASRILASGSTGTDDLLHAAILDADDALQSEIIDVLARRTDALSLLLQSRPDLELGPTAMDRLGRAMVRDNELAQANLQALSLLTPAIQTTVLRSLAWGRDTPSEVVDLLCAHLADESLREEAITSAGGLPATSVDSFVPCVQDSPDVDTRVAALRALLRIVRRHATHPDADTWRGDVEALALTALTDQNGSVSRLGIGVCIELMTETCVESLAPLSTTDPDPQLRADAYVARIASGDEGAILQGLGDESPTVRLAVANLLVRRSFTTVPIDLVETLMLTETWPEVTLELTTWLVFTEQGRPEFLAQMVGQLGGADGAFVARIMDTAGVFPDCASLFPLISTKTNPSAGETAAFTSSVLSLSASCDGYDRDTDPLASFRGPAAEEPRVAWALLTAAAAHDLPWAEQLLRAFVATEGELHYQAIRALPWFTPVVQQQIADQYADVETDERAIRIFESLPTAP